MEFNDETTEVFSPLNDVMLREEDKADILKTLRKEMNAKKPRRRINRGTISGFAAAAAAVAFVAGGFGYEMHHRQTTLPSSNGTVVSALNPKRNTNSSSNSGNKASNSSAKIKGSQNGANYGNEIALMKRKGYQVTTKVPNASVKTTSGETLSAWLGISSASQDGHSLQVLFFLNGKYLGTDTATPSPAITSVKPVGNSIAVTYPVYKATDSLANPTGTPVTITYTWNGSKLVPNRPYPLQFQGGNSTTQNQISTKSYATSSAAANQVASIEGSSPSGTPVNLGYGITAKESAAMGQARYAWSEGNWTIEVRYYTNNTGAKQVAQDIASYLHTHMLPVPNTHGVIVVSSTDAKTATLHLRTTIAWQEATQVKELSQTGNPIQALQTVVNGKS